MFLEGSCYREDAPEEDGDGELKLDLSKMTAPAEFKDPKKTLRGEHYLCYFFGAILFPKFYI